MRADSKCAQAGDDFAGMIVEGEDEDGLGGRGPPMVGGRVVLPKFADGAGLPAAAGLWAGLGSRRGERGQVRAAPSGDGGARAVKIQASREFISEQAKLSGRQCGRNSRAKAAASGGHGAA